MFRRIVMTCAVLLLLDACGSNSPDGDDRSPQSVPFAPTADSDSFYAQPDPLPDAPSGTILKSRATSFTPAAGVPMLNPAWQIQYLTRDVNDQPLAAVATVVKPLVPALGGRRPLVSYQFAYDSLGSRCSPSHVLSGDLVNPVSQAETAAYLPGLTALGWTMIFPDYEGPTSAFGAGKLSGQATLDGIRAALAFAPLGLSAQTPVAMWGYSGGALATAWAATLQARYAPELNIVGAASGGTPADVLGIVRNAENKVFFGLIFSGVVGATRAYPELIPEAVLTDEGRRVIAATRDGCLGLTTDGSRGPHGRLADYVDLPDPYTSPGALAVGPQLMLPQAGQTPITDVYVYHEVLDELVPIAGVDAMVAAWCADGAKVRYNRNLLGGEHATGAVVGAPFAVTYLNSRLSGTPAVLPLGTRSCN